MGHLGLAQPQRAVFQGVAVLLERVSGAPQPGASDRRTGLEAVVLVEPDSTLSRPAVLTELVVNGVGALAIVDALVEAAQPPSRVGEEVEALGLSCSVRLELADRRGGVIGALPVATRPRRAGDSEAVALAQGLPLARRSTTSDRSRDT